MPPFNLKETGSQPLQNGWKSKERMVERLDFPHVFFCGLRKKMKNGGL